MNQINNIMVMFDEAVEREVEHLKAFKEIWNEECGENK